MKNKILFIQCMSILVFSCGVERDNPLDPLGDKFVKPSIQATGINLIDSSICRDTFFMASLQGNSDSFLYCYAMDNAAYSNWSNDPTPILTELSPGLHTVSFKGKYTYGTDIAYDSIRFLTLPSSALYLSPVWINSTGIQRVTLRSKNIPDSVVTLHCLFINAVIDSICFGPSLNASTALLVDSQTIDIAIPPGNKALIGDVEIFSIFLRDFKIIPPSISIEMRDKQNSMVLVESVFGVYFKE